MIKKTCRVRLLGISFNSEYYCTSDCSCGCKRKECDLYPATDWQDIAEEDFNFLKKQIESGKLRDHILIREDFIGNYIEEFRNFYKNNKAKSKRKEEVLVSRKMKNKTKENKKQKELEWAKKVIKELKNV